MANEATIRSSLTIKKGNIDFASRPGSFQADVSGTNGPTPGAIAVATAGTDVDLSELTTPGLINIKNLDTTNFLEFGIWDGATFHELGEVQAGEDYTFRLSRNFTSTSLRLKADTAAVKAVVSCFEA